MGTLDLSVQVLNISLKASMEDLITFFSYCGTIDEFQLHRDGDQSQSAVVTFRQPYARQTALLLNDAIIVDKQVCILPLQSGINIPITSCSPENMNRERGGGSVPATQCAAMAAALRGQEVLNKAKDRVSGTGRILAQQAITAISAAEQTAGSCFSKGALWLSDVLEHASKTAAELGNAKSGSPNCRKQKKQK